MKRVFLWFARGPGLLLVICGVIIAVGFAINQQRQKQADEAEKRQKQRELGQVNPGEHVDNSLAQKEVQIGNGTLLHPLNASPASQPTPQQISLSPAQRTQALPQLVSFYTQVQAVPSPTPGPEAPRVPEIWLPPSSLIPCVLVITVESSHINTPVLGKVLVDIVQNGHLVIPKGTVVSCFAQSGAVRDRIEVAGSWLLVYPDGRQLKINGLALNRDAHPDNQQFGVEDGSAGLQGEEIESDRYANFKALVALFITGAAQTGTAIATSALQAQHTTGVTSLPDTTPILAKYMDQLLNGESGDGRFIRVTAGTEFYIFPTDTILPTHRSAVTTGQLNTGESPAPVSGSPMEDARQMEQELMRSAQPQASPQGPKLSY